METIFLIVCIALGVGATAWVWWYENGPQKSHGKEEEVKQQEEKGESNS